MPDPILVGSGLFLVFLLGRAGLTYRKHARARKVWRDAWCPRCRATTLRIRVRYGNRRPDELVCTRCGNMQEAV